MCGFFKHLNLRVRTLLLEDAFFGVIYIIYILRIEMYEFSELSPASFFL
jgi:hypothetical protein